MNPKIPGPSGSLIGGNLSEFRAGMLPFFERCRTQYGTVVSFRLGTRRLVLVSDPDLIEEVLVHQNKAFKKHFGVRLLKPVLGNGLLLSEGETWLRQRRLIQPTFSRTFHQSFVEIVRRHAQQLALTWRSDARRDLYRDMTELTVRIAAEAFLGIQDPDMVADLGEHLKTIHHDFEYRFQHPFTLPTWIPTSRNRTLRRAVRGLTTIIDRMIDVRRQDPSPSHDALTGLLRARDEAGQGIPVQLLRDEVMTLLLAGHDTTANGLTWTWILLAKHPHVMTQLRETLSNGPAVTELPRCDLADRIFKESMRLYPPVYLFGREARHDVSLGDYVIRRGESVVLSQWIVHRDPNYFSDPLEFRPDRWSDEFERSLPNYAYFPFGGGPRVCIGKAAAQLEAATIVRTLAREFTIKLDAPDDVQPWPTVTLRPRDPVWASVECSTAKDGDAHASAHTSSCANHRA